MTPPETVGSILGAVAASFAKGGFAEPRRRARRLVATALGLSAAEVFAFADRMVLEDEAERVAAMLDRALAGEPLSRMFGVREFWGLEFRLSADALDPRPETETIVEAILARMPERKRAYRVLDLGTGSGCLLLALLSEFRVARGIGVDIAEGAVATARGNAAALGLAERAHFVVEDWGAALAGEFDIVVANPPYIATGDIAGLPREVRDFDPRRALDGGADGLAAYRSIIADLPRLLAAEGIFAAEIGWGQQQAVAALLAEAGLMVDGFAPDLAGIPRVAIARNQAIAANNQKMVGTALRPV
jgi:release factor glutamine methyltransferase